MKKIIRIVLTLPNGIDEENTVAFQCINNLEDTDEYHFEYYPVIGASVGKNRNFGITEGIQLIKQTRFNFDSLLFVDYDIQFTQENVLQLLDKKKFIISGLYELKSDKNKAVCGSWGVKEGIIGNNIDYNDMGLKNKIDWCGAGFLLINSYVFKNMEYPYFTHEKIEYQNCRMETSEDLGFAINLKKFGFSIWVDCDCKVKHI